MPISAEQIRREVEEDNRDTLVTKIDAALARVRAEMMKAMTKHGPMHSLHEAYGVIKEELDEFFDEVRADNAPFARMELVQVAAMAARALVDLADYNPKKDAV